MKIIISKKKKEIVNQNKWKIDINASIKILNIKEKVFTFKQCKLNDVFLV